MVRTLKVSVERKTFSIRFKGHQLKSNMGFNKIQRKSRVHLMEVCFNNHGRFIRLSEFAPNRKSTFLSFANVVREEGPRRGGLVPVGRWARAVVCECHANFVNWAEVDCALAKRLGHKALIEVLDGGWEFTISVAVVGVEDIRRGREMGESTREEYEPHSWTGGRRRVEDARSTLKEGLLLGQLAN
ncbi:hypothetical protein CK203_088904 [Vitis vinifera]|uniref:Uncharacterized protein n=1 Tax=Vitis vinifera TaxID=29760 RepID=A0A438D0X2_VITVI|nr:hypothetical protein CK203_088904 [Vitis vinifera]